MRCASASSNSRRVNRGVPIVSSIDIPFRLWSRRLRSGEGKQRRGGGPPPLNMSQVRTATLAGTVRIIWTVLLRRLVRRGYGNDHPAFRALAERHLAGFGGEDGVIATEAHIGARVELRAALANDDVACKHLLAAEALHAEALGIRIAAVASGAACFLVGHRGLLQSLRVLPPVQTHRSSAGLFLLGSLLRRRFPGGRLLGRSSGGFRLGSCLGFLCRSGFRFRLGFAFRLLRRCAAL